MDLSAYREAGPLEPLLCPGHIVADAGRPNLDAPMPLVGLAGLAHGRRRIVEERARIVVQGFQVQGFWAALEGQYIIAPGPARATLLPRKCDCPENAFKTC